MRFQKLDLNLLVALDVLLEECNVTRAAQRLHLSQSAMSNALARLRHHLRDDLLVRVGRRMVMTERARTMQPEVSDILRRLEARILSPAEFDARTVERSFVVMAADAISLPLLSRVSSHIRNIAPGVSLALRIADESPAQQLARGRVDMLILPRQYISATHPFEHLYNEPFCAVVCENSAWNAETLDHPAYLAAEHVTLELGNARKVPVDRAVIEQRYGVLRSSATVTSHASVPWYVIGTQRIATLPLFLAKLFAENLPLRTLPLPFELPENQVVLQWHEQSASDLGLDWLRGEIVTMVQRIYSPVL